MFTLAKDYIIKALNKSKWHKLEYYLNHSQIDEINLFIKENFNTYDYHAIYNTNNLIVFFKYIGDLHLFKLAFPENPSPITVTLPGGGGSGGISNVTIHNNGNNPLICYGSGGGGGTNSNRFGSGVGSGGTGGHNITVPPGCTVFVSY